jgi:PST family polysaccharide transporter
MTDNSALRGVSWTFLSYGVNRVLTFATTLVLARLLVPSDFGLLALATLAIGLFGLFRDLGLGSALVVRQDFTRRDQGTVLTLMLVTGVLLAAGVAALSPLAAMAFEEPRLDDILPLLTLSLILGAVTGFYSAVMQRELRFRRQFGLSMVQTVAYSACAIPMAALGTGIWSLVVGQIVGMLAACLAVPWLAPYLVRPRFERRVARAAIGSGGGFMVQGWLAFVEENVDYLVVGRALGARELGFYSMAYRLGELPLRAIAGPIAQVTFPNFAAMRERGESLDGVFLSALRLVAVVTCPLGAVLSATADPFTRAVLGGQWTPMIGALSVLGLWAAVRPVQFTIGWLLNSIGQAALLAAIATAILVAFVPALVVAATLGGLTAVAWATLGDVVVSLVAFMVFTQRRAGVAMRAQWRALWPTAIALVPCWAAARSVVELTTSAPSGVSLVLSAAAGLGVYGGAMLLLEPELVRSTIRRLSRRARTP